MMSLGIRSGVHWMRAKEPVIDEARALAAVVLASPGTDSSSTCPPAASAASRVRRRFSWPTTREWNTPVMVLMTAPLRSRSPGAIAGAEGAKSPGRRAGAPAWCPDPDAEAADGPDGGGGTAGRARSPDCWLGGLLMRCG